MFRSLALALLLLCASTTAMAGDALRLTEAELDEVLTDHGGSVPTLPGGEGGAAVAPRRWWPLALSAVVPGLGEVSTGHLRGIPMIVADGAIWWGVYDKNREGDDKEKEYEAHADAHWSEARWEQALAAGDLEPFFPEYGPGTTKDDVPLYVSREVDRREWYENAGKWDQFAWGWREYWDDLWNAQMHPIFIGPDLYAPQPAEPSTWFYADNPTMTPLRRQYIEMREASNSAYETRDTLMSAALLLRVFSVLQMVYLEGFVGRRYDAASEEFAAAPQAGWSARAGVDGNGMVAWRLSW